MFHELLTSRACNLPVVSCSQANLVVLHPQSFSKNVTFDEFTQTTVTVGFSTQLTPTPINSPDYNIYICYMFHSIFHSIPFHVLCFTHNSIYYRGYFFAKENFCQRQLHWIGYKILPVLISPSMQVQVTGVVAGACMCVFLASCFSISLGTR